MDPHRSQGQVLISELPFSRLTQYDETMSNPDLIWLRVGQFR